MADSFAFSACRLAGLSGALLGWRPREFWAATPVEFEQVLRALSPPDEGAVDRATIARLKEQFPDG